MRLAIALCLSLLPFATAPALAQSADSTTAVQRWKRTGVLSLDVTQGSFSDNWAGGDNGSFVWVANLNSTAEKQFGPRFNLQNRLELAYGQTAQQVQQANSTKRVWQTPDKTTDRILFESTGRFTTGSWAEPYAGLRLDSQFRDESYAPVAILDFNPVKLKESAGMIRVFVKTADREAVSRLGVGARQTIGRSINAVTLATEHFTSSDGGLEWQTNVTQPLFGSKVVYKGELLIFQALIYSQATALNDYVAKLRTGDATQPADPHAENVADFWKAPDVNFQNTFTTHITRYLGVNLFVQWVYDKFDNAANVNPSQNLDVLSPEVSKNIRKSGQFKETLALNFKFSIF
ncbi:MAG TPA: DUF3078 domain-containing protein [Candidatus Sulfotelmatobacter sp.]|nr:DUF3078 domain-containing protein [Candidatus Sulfotelmatobacter sp.]